MLPPSSLSARLPPPRVLSPHADSRRALTLAPTGLDRTVTYCYRTVTYLAGLDRTTSAFLDALAPFAQSGCNSWAHAATALGVQFDELPHLPPRYPDIPTPALDDAQHETARPAMEVPEAPEAEAVVGAACVPDTSGSVRFTLRVAQRMASVEVG